MTFTYTGVTLYIYLVQFLATLPTSVHHPSRTAPRPKGRGGRKKERKKERLWLSVRASALLSEGCWFNSPVLHLRVSLGKILNPKLPTIWCSRAKCSHLGICLECLEVDGCSCFEGHHLESDSGCSHVFVTDWMNENRALFSIFCSSVLCAESLIGVLNLLNSNMRVNTVQPFYLKKLTALLN